MSSIEVSLVTSNYETKSTQETTPPQPQRPPPPPPSSSSSSSSVTSKQCTDRTSILLESETCLSSTQISSEPIDNITTTETAFVSKFKYLFTDFDYETVREQILNRQMIECDFTTVLWRIFLHCLPRDSNQWTEMLDTTRNNYEKLVLQYSIDPYKMGDNHNDSKYVNHPLSRDENSLWAQYFADEELKTTITTDVRRTCPDIGFFRNPRMMDLQLRILFTHSRHHRKTTPYRQGMHEILGIVVYAIQLEAIKANECSESTILIKKLYDPQYLEHDAYAIFEKIIDHLRQFYTLTTNSPPIRKPVTPNGTKQKPFQRFNDVHTPQNDTVVRMNSIFDRLRHYNQFLHGKLQELNIEPTVYGIRWLRLLFGREIPFEAVPKLWTVIFCFDEHFGFVDYFFIALLMQVAQIITNQEDGEHFSYLESLMKQNVITDAEPVIRKALNLTGRQLQLLPEPAAVPSIRKKDENQPNLAENDRENTPHKKELQRVTIAAPPKPRLTRPFTVEMQKSIVAASSNFPNQSKESGKSSSSSNTSSASTLQVAAPLPATIATHSEMDLWSGKSIRQRYDDNIQLQQCCAQFMHKFIEQLQKQIYDLEAPSEDVLHIQLSGLKQIANVLEGKLNYDSNALQSLVDYKSKEKHVEPNHSDTS